MTDGVVAAEVTVSAPFWAAAERDELVLQRCDACEAFVWYPRALCPGCGSATLSWVAVSAWGTVYAVTVHHRAPRPELAALVPYAVVLVDLDEGVRMMARMTGVPAEEVAVGDRVRWRPDPEGGRAFVFEPG
jgi:uncharacterized OB-fold protein